jgi:hypothetical protein
LLNFEESLKKLTENKQWYNCIDQRWNLLIVKDNWYGIDPVLLYQRDGYSDIENKNRNLKYLFNIK